MAMIEEEQRHRITFEQAALKAEISDVKRGHYIGLAIGGAAIAGAIVTALVGAHPTVSIALVGLPIAGIIRSIIRRGGEDRDDAPPPKQD